MKSIYRFKVKDIGISTRKKTPLWGLFHSDPEGSGDYRIADQRLSKLPVGTTGCAPAITPPPANAEAGSVALGCSDCAPCCGLACGCGGCVRASCLGSDLGSGLAAGLAVAAAVAVRTGAGFAAEAGAGCAATG